jgi:hypothetical protein
MIERIQPSKLTVSEVHIDVVRSYIRSHGNDWNSRPNVSNANSSRDTIEVGHDYIHKNKVKLVSPIIDLVHGFEAIPL